MAEGPSPFLEGLVTRIESKQAGMVAEVVAALHRRLPTDPDAEDVSDADIHAIARQAIDAFLRTLRGQRGLSPEGLDLVRALARRRAEEHEAPMAALMGAYRVAMSVSWQYAAREMHDVRFSAADADRIMDVSAHLFDVIDEISSALAAASAERSAAPAGAGAAARLRLVGDLVSGAFSDADIDARALALGHDLRVRHAVVGVAPAASGRRWTNQGPRRGTYAAATRQLADAVTRRLSQDLPAVVVDAPTPHAVAIVPVRVEAEWPRLLDACRAMAEQGDTTIVASPPVAGARALQASCTEVQNALPLADRVLERGTRVVCVDDLRIYRVLEGKVEEQRTFVSGLLGAICRLPASRCRVLLGSLEAWYEADGKVEEAAEALFVHPNTLRYRIRRVEELTGLSARKPKDLARLYLALRLLKLDETRAAVEPTYREAIT